MEERYNLEDVVASVMQNVVDGDLADKWHINDLIAEAVVPALKGGVRTCNALDYLAERV